jgi:hypothetical protein
MTEPTFDLAKMLEEIKQAEIRPHESAEDTIRKFAADLRATNVTQLVATYSGSNDEGWIDQIELIHADGTRAPLLAGQNITAEMHDKLEGALFGFCPPGFEINEGGHGKITVDTATGRATVEDYYGDYGDY